MVSNKQRKKQIKQKPTKLGRALRTLGQSAGTAVGGYFGSPATGGFAGRTLGAAVSKWLGAGDYTISQNSLLRASSGTIPMMHQTSQSVVIRHREFVREVVGSTGFAIAFDLILQPGNGDAFPWLSGIAHNFQQYKWKGVVFHYIPTSGHAISGTNPAIGSVMMQTSYRSTDAAPKSKQELLNEYCANEAAPDDSFCHPIECDPKENPFSIHYVRTGDPPEGDTRMMYDLGVTYVCTNGMPGTNTVGDLWVTYEVEFYKPLIKSNATTDVFYAQLDMESPTPLNMFRANVVAGDLELTSVAPNVFTLGPGLPGGIYDITVALYSITGFTAFNFGTPTLSGCTFVPVRGNNITSSSVASATGMVSAEAFLRVEIANNYTTATITWSSTWTGTAAHGFVRMVRSE